MTQRQDKKSLAWQAVGSRMSQQAGVETIPPSITVTEASLFFSDFHLSCRIVNRWYPPCFNLNGVKHTSSNQLFAFFQTNIGVFLEKGLTVSSDVSLDVIVEKKCTALHQRRIQCIWTMFCIIHYINKSFYHLLMWKMKLIPEILSFQLWIWTS